MSFQRAGTALNVAGAPSSMRRVVNLGADHACGQTSTHLPHWMQSSSSHTGNLQRDVALLPLRGGGGEGAVDGHGAHRQVVAFAAMILAVTFCTNSGAAAGTGGRMSNSAVTLRRDLHLVQVVERRVHRGEVLLHHASPRLP